MEGVWLPVRESLPRFLFRQLFQKWFWILFLVNFGIGILYGSRAYLKNKVFWDIK